MALQPRIAAPSSSSSSCSSAAAAASSACGAAPPTCASPPAWSNAAAARPAEGAAAVFAVPGGAELPELELAAARAVWAGCAADGLAEAAAGAPEAAECAAPFALLSRLRGAVRGHFAAFAADEAAAAAAAGADVGAGAGAGPHHALAPAQPPPSPLEGVVRFLTKWTLNLRSALSRNAVVAAGELAAAAQALLVPLAGTDALVAALLQRACSDKKFIRSEAELALDSLAKSESRASLAAAAAGGPRRGTMHARSLALVCGHACVRGGPAARAPPLVAARRAASESLTRRCPTPIPIPPTLTPTGQSRPPRPHTL